MAKWTLIPGRLIPPHKDKTGGYCSATCVDSRQGHNKTWADEKNNVLFNETDGAQN